jgi:hypothetical protein
VFANDGRRDTAHHRARRDPGRWRARAFRAHDAHRARDDAAGRRGRHRQGGVAAARGRRGQDRDRTEGERRRLLAERLRRVVRRDRAGRESAAGDRRPHRRAARSDGGAAPRRAPRVAGYAVDRLGIGRPARARQRRRRAEGAG